MATSYKVLGQLAPSANTATTLYTVPSATQTVCSTLAVCNRGTASAAYRIAVRPAGAALSTSQYIVYDTFINPNDSVFLSLGMSLAATDVVTCYTTGSSVSFSLFGSEIA